MLLANVPFIHPGLPLNMVVWAYSGLILILFGIKNYRIFHSTHNDLNVRLARFVIVLGGAVYWYAMSGLLFDDVTALRVMLTIGDVAVMASMLWQARLTHSLGFFSDRTLYLLYGLIGVVMVVAFYLGVTQLSIQTQPYLLTRTFHPLRAWVQLLVFTLVLVPTGYFFVKSGLTKATGTTRFKVVAFGLVYLVGYAIEVHSYAILLGSETLVNAALNALTFTVLLVIALSPSPGPTRTEARVLRSGSAA